MDYVSTRCRPSRSECERVAERATGHWPSDGGVVDIGKSRMDHLVYTSPDLDEGVRKVEALLGVRSSVGGRHQGVGTHNRLIGLGPSAYLEIVGVDPDQTPPTRARWFSLDEDLPPRLASWCVARGDLAAVAERAEALGLPLGDIRTGERESADGTRLAWTMTDAWADRLGGAVPFFIDWGPTRHPASDLDHPCDFLSMRIGHPRPDRLRAVLDALQVDAAVEASSQVILAATLRTPNGVVELT